MENNKRRENANDEIKKEVIRLYAETSLSQREIAKETGLGVSTVSRILKNIKYRGVYENVEFETK